MARISEVGSRKKLKVQFDSVPEVFKVIKKLNWTPQHSQSSNDSGRGSFHTFNNLAECKDVFQNHPDRIREFSINDDRLESRDSPGKDVEYDVTGDYLDIGRYLEGIPEVFGNAVMGNPKSVFCTINVLDCFVSYTSPVYQLAKQKRILRLVDWLEGQGIRCQIVAASDSEVIDSSVIVKEFHDNFDLNNLAIVLHPDWLRRIMFLVMEQSKTWEGGYGTAVKYDKRMQAYKPEPEDGVYVYVGGYLPYGNYSNATDGVVMLNEQFDKIEASIAELIDNGLTFNEEPLMISGETSRW